MSMINANVYDSHEVELELDNNKTETDSSEHQDNTNTTKTDKSLVARTLHVFCRCLACAVCLLLVAGAVALAIFVIDENDDDPLPIARCGDCHCIPDQTVLNCPINVPQTNFSTELIEGLRAQEPLNALPVLSCDPYQDDICNYVPPLVAMGPDAVCGLHYTDTSCSSYKLQSYANSSQAEAAGAFVTHFGECGVCSTMQDLSVYLEFADLTTFGSRCFTRALARYDAGVECLQDLGFTEACADIWIDNARNTGRRCALTCALTDLRDTPNNGNTPLCTLNECLQCDEDESGPIFKQFAGRTRRTSGLLSPIARLCSELEEITHEVCPITTPLAD